MACSAFTTDDRPTSARARGWAATTGGASGTLVVTGDSTGSFFSTGLKNINVRLGGVELNSSRVFGGNGTGSVTIQAMPNPQYVGGSLQPDVVSGGSFVQFQLTLINPLLQNATITLNRSLTRLRFGTGLFEAALDPSSEDMIPGGQIDTLIFDGEQVNPLIASGLFFQFEFHADFSGPFAQNTQIPC